MQHSENSPASPMSRHHWLLLIVLLLAELALAFEIQMIYAAVPTLNKEFGDPVMVGWLITGFLLVSAVSAAIGGRLGDMFGHKRVAIFALCCAALGSFVSGFSNDFFGVCLGRTLQGLAACVFPLMIGIARMQLPQDRVAFAVGAIAASAGIGTFGGYLLGGAIVDHFGWHYIFFLSGTLACIGIVGLWLVVPASATRTAQPQGIDWLGGLLFAPGIAGLLYALHELRTGHGGTTVTSIIVISSVIMVFWVYYELHHKNPIIDLRLIFSGQIRTANLLMMCLAVSQMQIPLVATMILQQPTATGTGFGLSATTFGLALIPGAVLSILSAPISGWFAGKLGARRVLFIGIFCILLSWIAMAAYRESVAYFVVMLTLSQIGGMLLFSNIPNLIIENSVSKRTSELVGFSLVLRHLSGGIGTQLALMLLHTSTVSLPEGKHPYPTDDSYLLFFVVMAAVTLIMMAMLYFSRPRQPMTAAAAEN